MTRRRFLTLAGLAGLALAGCGGAQSSPASSSPAAASPASAAAKPSTPSSAAASAAAKPSGAASAAASAAAKPSGSAAAAPSSAPVPQTLIDAAKKEGKLTYYSSTIPTSTQRIIEAFKGKYGIDVDFVRLASGPLAQRYAAEADAGNFVADVVQISDPLFFDTAVSKGWLAKIDDLPSLTQWPKDAWNGTSAKVHVGPLTLTWNTDVVKGNDVPKGWEDMLKPAFKGGKILVVDPRNAPILGSFWLLMMKTYGEDFLKKVAAQEPRLVASSVPGSQQLAAGSGSLLVPGTRSDALELKKEKAPVEDMFPSPTVGNESSVGVTAKSARPNGARLLLNFLLTPEAQAIYVKDGYSSVLPNIPGAEPLPKGYTGPSPKEAADAMPKLLDLLNIH
jgi:iron(III) transport system substrate-binding protein